MRGNALGLWSRTASGNVAHDDEAMGIFILGFTRFFFFFFGSEFWLYLRHGNDDVTYLLQTYQRFGYPRLIPSRNPFTTAMWIGIPNSEISHTQLHKDTK